MEEKTEYVTITPNFKNLLQMRLRDAGFTVDRVLAQSNREEVRDLRSLLVALEIAALSIQDNADVLAFQNALEVMTKRAVTKDEKLGTEKENEGQ